MTEKIVELEDEVRDIFSRHLNKELTTVMQGVSVKSRFLLRFKYGHDKDMTLNQLTIMTVDSTPVSK